MTLHEHEQCLFNTLLCYKQKIKSRLLKICKRSVEPYGVNLGRTRLIAACFLFFNPAIVGHLRSENVWNNERLKTRTKNEKEKKKWRP